MSSIFYHVHVEWQGVKFLCRSKKETVRLHQLNKPIRKPLENDLLSIHSHDEDEDEASWSSGLEDEFSVEISASGDEISNISRPSSSQELDSDAEMPFEAAPRKRHPSWDSDNNHNVHHLPTKLADGRIQQSVRKPTAVPAVEKLNQNESDSDAGDQDQSEREERYRVEDVSTGARFGRPAVVDVIGNKSRKVRIQGAKDQIAGICQEIIADPENSVSMCISITVIYRLIIFNPAWSSEALTHVLTNVHHYTCPPRPCI